MSVREFPSDDSESRQERAEQVDIQDVRTISGDQFGVPDDTNVYEVDLVNEQGESRENVVIIPRVLFENTKDVQYRHDEGIVGKYSRALAMESDDAREELLAGIQDKRDAIQSETAELRNTDSRLLHTQADLNGL
jgi:hypothetical protein